MFDYEEDDVIDEKFVVKGICSDTGGMGIILFVDKIYEKNDRKLVMKICRDKNEDAIIRFKREIFFLNQLKGKTNIVSILDSNPDHEPPYYIMHYYPNGDLIKMKERMRNDYVFQEKIFMLMIDCVDTVFSNNVYHRDIKPQNFLWDGDKLLISDFGLGCSTQTDERTSFTSTSLRAGTEGFMPPEYDDGGFKHHDIRSDIFMLGKSFYKILSDGSLHFILNKDGKIPEPVYTVIKKCCEPDLVKRYKTFNELRQSLVEAYNIISNRADSIFLARKLNSKIKENIDSTGTFNTQDVTTLVQHLSNLDENEFDVFILTEVERVFFEIISDENLSNDAIIFLEKYKNFALRCNYSYSYADTISRDMTVIFERCSNIDIKVLALECIVIAAKAANRFNAMDHVNSLISGITNDHIALKVGDMLRNHKYHFILKMSEFSNFKSNTMKNMIFTLAGKITEQDFKKIMEDEMDIEEEFRQHKHSEWIDSMVECGEMACSSCGEMAVLYEDKGGSNHIICKHCGVV